MNDNQENLSSIFSKNRAEEFGYDVWEHFVIPPFFDRLDLEVAKKTRSHYWRTRFWKNNAFKVPFSPNYVFAQTGKCS